MEEFNEAVPLTRRDLLKLRTLVLTENVPRNKWRQMHANLVAAATKPSEHSTVHLSVEADVPDSVDRANDPLAPSSSSPAASKEEILQTLTLWHDSNRSRPTSTATLSNLLDLLRRNELKDLAKSISSTFRRCTVPQEQEPGSQQQRPNRQPPPQKPSRSSQPAKPAARLGWWSKWIKARGASGADRNDFKLEITAAVPKLMKHAQNLQQVLALLLSEDVLTANELELVQSKPNDSDRWATLAFLFIRKWKPGWEKFKDALADVGNKPLADSLKNYQ